MSDYPLREEYIPPKRNGGVIPLSDLLDNGSDSTSYRPSPATSIEPLSIKQKDGEVQTQEEEDTVDEDAELLLVQQNEENESSSEDNGYSENEGLDDISDDDTAGINQTIIMFEDSIDELDSDSVASTSVPPHLDTGKSPDPASNISTGKHKLHICYWEACNKQEPDIQSLVAHLYRSHIGVQKSTYACQWDACPRKGVPQPSRFALNSHMRIHTNERPFFCIIPECDRNFPRADALVKHIHTVHGYDHITGEVDNCENIKHKEPKEPLAKAKALNPGLLAEIRKIREKESLYNGSEVDDLPATIEDESDPNSTINKLKRKLIWSLEMQEQLEAELKQVKKQKDIEILRKEKLFDDVLVKHLGNDSAQLLSLS